MPPKTIVQAPVSVDEIVGLSLWYLYLEDATGPPGQRKPQLQCRAAYRVLSVEGAEVDQARSVLVPLAPNEVNAAEVVLSAAVTAANQQEGT
jgi:hypothetical protein